MERLVSAWFRWESRVARQWQRPEALTRLRRELSLLAAEVYGQGRRLLVATMPDRFALRDPVAFGLPRRTLLAELQAQGIDAVDLHRVFADHPDPDSLFLLADPIHLSPQGHALVARTLAPYLDARLPAPGNSI